MTIQQQTECLIVTFGIVGQQMTVTHFYIIHYYQRLVNVEVYTKFYCLGEKNILLLLQVYTILVCYQKSSTISIFAFRSISLCLPISNECQ